MHSHLLQLPICAVLLAGLILGSGGPVGNRAAAAGPQQPSQSSQTSPAHAGQWRGVFFNPHVPHAAMAGYPWPVFKPYRDAYRQQIRAALHQLADETHLNFIALFIPIPFTLAHPPQGPEANQPLAEWADMTYLDHVALFIDDCHAAGLSVELDLADNRWVPYSVDSAQHIGRPGNPVWPVADDTPWDEAATWYREVIEYVESRTQHPERIAMWCMMGNYQLGTAEPCLWNTDANPAILAHTREFVRSVWPVFRAAGSRPKAAPIMLPIFSNTEYWMRRTPEERLSALSNLKRWIVDELAQAPDYWLLTAYPYCDPAPDGVYYLRRMVEILGPENAARVIVTDLKGPGHELERKESIIPAEGHTGSELLAWHFQKCAEYGFAGWWIYSYQDQDAPDQRTGIRHLDGTWKRDLWPLMRDPAAADLQER